MQRFLGSVFLWTVLAAKVWATPIGSKKGIFVVPGAFVAPAAYADLTEKISARLGGEVKIAFAEDFARFPREESTKRQLQDFIDAIEQSGYQPDITVIGHSQGGLAAAALSGVRYSRLVLMGSYLQSDWLQNSSPAKSIPVLSLGGTLDRQSRPGRVAFDAFLYSGLYPFQALLLEGVSHFQFADGKSPIFGEESGPETERAHDLMAKFIAAFMEDNLQSLDNDPDYKQAKAQVQGYVQSFAADQLACNRAQLAHLGVEEDTHLKINATLYKDKKDYGRFILDKSWLRVTAPDAEIGIYQFAEMRPAPLDIAPLREASPEVIACKLKSSEAVSLRLGKPFKGRSCAEENLQILVDSYKLLPQDRRDLLKESGLVLDGTRLDRGISSQEETIGGPGFEITNTFKGRGDEWALGSIFSAKLEGSLVRIHSYSVQTPTGNPNNPFLGAYYCKLIAPSRAYLLLETLSR